MCLYFQRDGAPPHNAYIINEHLNANLRQKWISNLGPIRSPARYPDVTSIDFLVWGFLKHYTVEEVRVRHANMQINI